MKKVLYITSADVMKTYNNGGEHACKTNLNHLYDLYGRDNVEVLFFSEYTGPLPNGYYAFRRLRRWRAAAVQLMGYKMYFPWEEKDIVRVINEIAPGIIFFDGVLTGTLLPRISSSIFKVVFEHNFEKKYYRLKMKHEGIMYAIEYFSVARNEKIAVKNCDCLICINQRDREEIYQEYGRKADGLLPISFENKFRLECVKKGKCNKELIFIGSNFGPNYDGIKWFVDNVMSQLLEFKLYIVGKNFENNKKDLERTNVVVIGSVENVEEYYYNYPVIVMPILYGSGMKVKTAEAMMYGRTIFATDEALEGYEVNNVKGIYRCNTAQEFIDGIDRICCGEMPLYQEEVQKLFVSRYSNDMGMKTLKRVLPTGEN